MNLRSSFVQQLIALFVLVVVGNVLASLIAYAVFPLPVVFRWAVSLLPWLVPLYYFQQWRGRRLGRKRLAALYKPLARFPVFWLIETWWVWASLAVLVGFRLLSGRLGELPQNLHFLIALAAGTGVGYALWQNLERRRVPGRQWVAGLSGLFIFLGLY